MFCRCKEEKRKKGGKYSFVKEKKKGEGKGRKYLEKGAVHKRRHHLRGGGRPKDDKCRHDNAGGKGVRDGLRDLGTNCIYWVNLGLGRERDTCPNFLAHWR